MRGNGLAQMVTAVEPADGCLTRGCDHVGVTQKAGCPVPRFPGVHSCSCGRHGMFVLWSPGCESVNRAFWLSLWRQVREHGAVDAFPGWLHDLRKCRSYPFPSGIRAQRQNKRTRLRAAWSIQALDPVSSQEPSATETHLPWFLRTGCGCTGR